MRDNVSQYVIKPLLAEMESGNLPFWTKPWKTKNGMPFNVLTKKNYHGGNRFMLMLETMLKGGNDPRWMGMGQANKIGAKVRKGEKGTMVWIPLLVKDKANQEEKLIGFKYGHVFHVSQFDNLDQSKIEPIEERVLPNNPITACEEWINRLNPKIINGVAASYSFESDLICIPKITAFDSSEKYYHILLHELGHWTGHLDRCNRERKNSYGSEKYGFEELIAEIFSLFAAYELGLEIEKEIPDSAAYIKGWMKSLTENPNWIPKAAEAAEKAMRFCLKGKIEIEESRHEEMEAVA